MEPSAQRIDGFIENALIFINKPDRLIISRSRTYGMVSGRKPASCRLKKHILISLIDKGERKY